MGPGKSVGVVWLLLRFFPRSFRHRFGEDLAATFNDRRRDAGARGRWATAAFLVRASVDTARHGLEERQQERRARGGRGLRETLMRSLYVDTRDAWRSLRRQPAFTALAAGMLAVGLVFNIALFAVVDAAILRPLPYRDASQLVLLWSGRSPDGSGAPNAPADFADWRDQARSFAHLAAFNISLATLFDDGPAEELRGSVVTRAFFDVLGAAPLLGRVFNDDDFLQATEPPLIISEQLWRRRYQADPDIVGRLVTLGDQPRRIVGVMPADLLHPEPFWYREASYWRPLRFSDGALRNRSTRYLRVIGRLRDDTTFDAARAEMDTIGRQLMEAHPETNSASVVMVRLKDQLIGNTRQLSWLFLAASGLVLFLAAMNIVNLLLARASRRQHELAVRTALGAGRWRLARQMALEGALLGGLAGALGLLLARASVPTIVARAPVSLPGLVDAGVTGRVLLVGLLLSIGAGAACGLLPAWRVARARFGPALVGSRTTSSLEARRARSWLVVAELAVATPLVVAALLLAQTLGNLQAVDPGFEPAGAVSFRVSLSGSQYDDADARVDFFRRLEDELRALPGATSTGIVTSLPMGGFNNTGGMISGSAIDDVAPPAVSGGFRMASGGYFESLGIEVIRGTTYGDAPSDRAAALVNERLARELWGDADPIGRQVRLGDEASTAAWHTVVGVTRDVRHVRLTEAPDPEVFLPYASDPWPVMNVVVRAETPRPEYQAEVADIVRGLDARATVVEWRAVGDIVAGGWARARFGALCAGLLALIGLALAAGGTFAVLSLLVAARRQEIGIRLALGAAPGRVRGLVLRQSMLPAVAGCAIGAVLASSGSSLLAATLFGIEPRDPLTLGVGIGSLVVAALAASWWPARRAMQVDPVRALREI